MVIRRYILFLSGVLLMSLLLVNEIHGQSLLEPELRLDWAGSVTYSPLGVGLNMRYLFPKSHFAVAAELSYMNGRDYIYQGSVLPGFGFTTYVGYSIPLATLPSPFAGPGLYGQSKHSHIFIQLDAGPGINYMTDNYLKPEKFRGSANFRTLFGMSADTGNGHNLFMEFGIHLSYLPDLHRRRWMVGPMLTIGILLF